MLHLPRQVAAVMENPESDEEPVDGSPRIRLAQPLKAPLILGNVRAGYRYPD